MNIKYLNLKNLKLLTILSVGMFLLAGIFSIFSPVSAACPTTGTLTPAQKNDPDCISNDLGLNQIDASRFTFGIGLNDIVSIVSTIILVLMVLLFGVKIVLAGIKWVNNDGQDKAKKDAIKSLTNGVVGIVIAFAAYFVVLLVRSVFGLSGGEQIVNCSYIYYGNVDMYLKNQQAGKIDDTDDAFKRCAKTSGIDTKLGNPTNWTTFNAGLRASCDQYITMGTSNSSLTVEKPKELAKCFVDQYNKIP